MEVSETSGGDRRSSDDDDVRVELATIVPRLDVTPVTLSDVTSCIFEKDDLVSY